MALRQKLKELLTKNFSKDKFKKEKVKEAIKKADFEPYKNDASRVLLNLGFSPHGINAPKMNRDYYSSKGIPIPPRAKKPKYTYQRYKFPNQKKIQPKAPVLPIHLQNQITGSVLLNQTMASSTNQNEVYSIWREHYKIKSDLYSDAMSEIAQYYEQGV